VADAFDEAANAVYNQGGFNASDMTTDAARKLLTATANTIKQGVDSHLPVDVPPTLRYALENNAFIFSGLKTFHALREVGLSMVKDDGSIKSFEEFKDDVKQINSKYNTNYLYAEYKHAVGTSQMAAKWVNIEADGDRYDLQYRTAGDDKVRPDHAALNGITLPPSDPFWSKYYPPNGWGCRCTAVQVRVGKYQRSNPADAMQAGDTATEEAKQKMFRYNSGKTMQLFPPKHPYYKASPEAKAVTQQVAKIECARSRYNDYLTDDNYNDVQFNESTGAIMATHVGHNVDNNKKTELFGMSMAQLERECQQCIFDMGHTAILRDESKHDPNGAKGDMLPALDLELDGIVMDIRSITTNGYYGNALTAKNKQLGNVKRKTGESSDSVCLYFHDSTLFDEAKLLNDMQWYKRRIVELGSKQRIKHVYVVVNGEQQLRVYDIE
jgi:SPP1 gp7 family putative phage head morphogenesis protein